MKSTLKNAAQIIDECDFLLIDPVNIQATGPHAILAGQACVPPGLDKLYSVMPQLTDIRTLSVEQRESLSRELGNDLSQQFPPRICAAIKSSASIKEVSQHLTRFMTRNDPTIGKVIWRFYDPRVFSVAAQIYDDEELCALLGPIKEWYFPLLGRIWCTQPTGEPNLSAYELGWPSAKHWDVLRYTDRISHALTHVIDTIKSSDDALKLARDAIRYLGEAIVDLKIKDVFYQKEFLRYCLRYGNNFRRHYKLISFWSGLRDGTSSWCEIENFLSPADVEAMELHLNFPQKEMA
ncbi:DUF4123 domain-containing protein [Pseudoduganella sp. SL102]|uniref:DUF4123 domain-containing protein n=1 Tax=Pseudoduganella sp. SL102 TaxID=2995154 RepID=UPI00248C1ADE|nr:DUF4123 domain-containing protein [Pseudoduganella sp. SL102]WBS02753.1 DUF4123 domain-containing protein [Pseudoduganella sp. SL102]